MTKKEKLKLIEECILGLYRAQALGELLGQPPTPEVDAKIILLMSAIRDTVYAAPVDSIL